MQKHFAELKEQTDIAVNYALGHFYGVDSNGVVRTRRPNDNEILEMIGQYNETQS